MKALAPMSLAVVVLNFCILASGAESAFEKKLPADVVAALQNGDLFAVMAIEPGALKTVPYPAWKVRKEVPVKDPAERKKVVEAIQDAVATAPSEPKKCFIPRHAIRVVNGQKVYVLVICFECSQIYVYVDGKREHIVLVGTSAEAVLNEILK